MSRKSWTKRSPRRRGVVLLVVLSLLALFTMLVVTFVIVTSLHRDVAEAAGRYRRYEEDPSRLADMAMYQVLRDTTTRSSVKDHSLLRDLYGHDGLQGAVTSVIYPSNNASQNPNLPLPNTQGQWIVIEFNATASQPFGSTASQLDDYYGGCVISMLTGASAGKSSRIAKYDYSPATVTNPERRRLYVDVSDAKRHGSFFSLAGGDQFIINGVPFNGAGHGYGDDTSTGVTEYNIDAKAFFPQSRDGHVALLPHFSAYTTLSNVTVNDVNSGGADEDWDTWDYQNMFLAHVPADPSSSYIIPSFHRPALINYWMNHPADNWNPQTASGGYVNWKLFRRSVILRPMPWDHPNFTGSNKYFEGTRTDLDLSILGTHPDPNNPGQFLATWDVDNDGDGIPDSIWLDLGFPAKTSQDGRLYKPLFAFLIQDLDGRLNINAHGNQIAIPSNLTSTFNTHPGPDGIAGTADDLQISAGANHLVRGQGIGPADVSLAPIFSDATELATILTQRNVDSSGDTAPGRQSGANDVLSAIKHNAWPNDYRNIRAEFGSPPDMRAVGAVALDHAGQPVYAHQGLNNEAVDDPYEAELDIENAGDVGGRDHIFSIADLEAILRYYDVDSAQLPSRLIRLADSTFSTAANRRLVTTHSSHIPVPRGVVPPEQRDELGAASARLLDLYRVKLQNVPNIQAQLDIMVPFEVRRGEVFDLNRPFGNGADDPPVNTIPQNFVIDEPLEAAPSSVLGAPNPSEKAWSNSLAPVTFRNSNFSHGNDDPLIADWRQNPRQIYARHLYCLMMLMVDQSYNHPGNTTAPDFHTAQAIAQWAVNVVDFRDSDAIMTPFEFDPTPFDATGWSVDGWIGNRPSDNVDDAAGFPIRPLVWGCEYPDLLISETLAFHDRRVRNTTLDDDTQTKTDDPDPNNRDEDTDQYRIPQGSLFLELYCPRNYSSNNPVFPAELYDTSTGQLDLGRLAPERAVTTGTARHPVWRVVTSAPTTSPFAASVAAHSANPPVPVPDAYTFDPQTTDVDTRVVWLAPHDPQYEPDPTRVYYGRTGSITPPAAPQAQAYSNVLLSPNHYVVVGPRTDTRTGSMIMGPDMNSTTHDPAQQQLNLTGGTFSATDLDPAAYTYPIATPNAGARIRQPGGIVCAADAPTNWTNQNRQIGMSVSEPVPAAGYYSEPNPTNDARVPFDAYANPALGYVPGMNELPDEPFDDDQNLPSTNTGTSTDFRSAFLQRLADPTLPWNPLPGNPNHSSAMPVNPYVTVDWATIDLTVFSGEDRSQQWDSNMDGTVADPDEWTDPQDKDPFGSNPPEAFFSRRRGLDPAAGTNIGIWSAQSFGMQATGDGNNDNYFYKRLSHTLGYINNSYSTLGPPPAAGYEGAPGTPFPWLAYNNRPFANPMELLLVPASSPSRLTYEFGTPSIKPFFGDTLDESPYGPANNPPDPSIQAFCSPFSHLLNFFHSGAQGATSGVGGNFSRLLSVVGVRSPFVGTETWYDASAFSNATEATYFRPPFNRLSKFREPGRININTITDFAVFEGLMKNIPDWDPATAPSLLSDFMTSRRGYAPTANADLNSDYPTRFSNPFRSAASADLMPPVTDLRKPGVEGTLLRSHPTATPTQPLFALDMPDASQSAYSNTDRNAYFRYQGMNRLSNLVTTNSNVFAVWVTVGYFELEPAGTVDDAHPDGYQLAKELESDRGQVKRHRAFYIIDRSIPVAFVPGENHNVDRAVLLRRFIE